MGVVRFTLKLEGGGAPSRSGKQRDKYWLQASFLAVQAKTWEEVETALSAETPRPSAKSASGKLGWLVEKKPSGYVVGLPFISLEEEELLFHLQEQFNHVVKKKAVSSGKEAKEIFSKALVDYCAANDVFMDKPQFARLVDFASTAFFGDGVFEPLLKDASLEEIAVIGVGKPIFVYRRGVGWLESNARFVSEEAIVDAVNKMARILGRRISLQSPRLNAVLANGSRLHATIAPVSSFEVTIRKFRSEPFSPGELVARNTVSSKALAFLWMALQEDVSVVISGNTASGKTSTLNSLFSFVPREERIVLVEETPELNLPHSHVVRLVSNKELGVSLSDLVADSIRMRPDRLVVGEVRTGEEVRALAEALLSSQARGTMATLHSSSAKETLSRLQNLGMSADECKAIDFIVVQRRILQYDLKTRRKWELRAVSEIAEVNKEDGEARATVVFKLNPQTMRAELSSEPSFLRKLEERWGCGRKELEQEWKKRASFLDNLSKQKTLSFSQSVSEIQSFAYV